MRNWSIFTHVSIPKLPHCGYSSRRSISAARTSSPTRRSRSGSVRFSYNGFPESNVRATDPCCFCRTALSTNNGPNPYGRRCDTSSFITEYPCKSRSHARTAVRRLSCWNACKMRDCLLMTVPPNILTNCLLEYKPLN